MLEKTERVSEKEKIIFMATTKKQKFANQNNPQKVIEFNLERGERIGKADYKTQ